MKVCKDCGQERPLSDFYLQKGRWPYPRCKACHLIRTSANRDARLPEVRARERERYRERDRGKHRSKHLRRKYGLDESAVRDLIAAQGNACAVCALPFADRTTGRDLREPVIDHDHETGEVRGVLHRECNFALALLGRLTPADLLRARAYLTKGGRHARRVA